MIHMILSKARRMPRCFAGLTGRKASKWFDFRILPLVFWMILSSFPIHADTDAQKTLKFLQLGFPNQTQEMQKKLLRDMALLDSEYAIPFFVGVAMDHAYSEDTRREALKGMIAVDSVKYRPILDTLQSTSLEDAQVLQAILQVGGSNMLPTFLSSLTFKEEKRILDMKLSAIHRFWRDSIVEKFDFSTWPSKDASKVLSELIMTTNHSDNRVRLIKLWEHVRDEDSTKEIVKLLDRPNYKVQEATILALSSPDSCKNPKTPR